jgi:DNA-binding beta-propeller fold protein YncE
MKTIKNVFSLNQLNLKTMNKEQRTMNSEQCTVNSAFSTFNFQFSINAALSLMLLAFSFFASCKKDGGNAAPLAITSFAPASAGYGATVTITGTGFSTTTANNTVTFNGVAATVTAATATELKVTVPKNKAATGKLKVGVGSNLAASATDFTYIPTATVSTLAGDGTANFKDGTGTAAQFNYPVGMALDGAGNLYVADRNNHRIRKITPAGVVSTVAGTGNPSPFTDGTVNVATFRYPMDVAVDASGNLYVVDQGNFRIRLITSGGMVSTVAGTGSATPFKDGGAAVATFNTPIGIVADTKTGKIYVADEGANRIRSIAFGTVSTWAGTGSTTPFTDGAGSMATFNLPEGIAADTSGNLYVTDWGNNRIRKITAGGMVSTLAGTGSATPFADGAGSAATFNGPFGVAVDAAGNVYVGDATNHRIRKITPDGTVSTLAGDGTANFKDGVGTAAQFNAPGDIAVTPDGSTIYVADRGNNKIRKIVVE